MKVSAHLDFDMVAVETNDRISLMVDFTAPLNEKRTARPGQAVQIVLDRSGSMCGERLNSAKFSILKLVDRLAPQDFFGLICFDDQALIAVPIKQMSEHDIHALRHAIQSIQPGGSTDLSSGYLLGLRELSNISNDSGATLILLSDGQANAGIKDPDQLRSVATNSASRKITSSTIGIGLGYDETLLASIAAGGGGHHRFAQTVDESVACLTSEVDDLLEKSAVNAIMKVKPVVGLASPKIEIVQDLPFWKDEDTYVVQLGDLYEGENRRFLVDFEVPGMAALGLCQIAEITLEYMNLHEMKDEKITLAVQVNVVPADIAAGRVIDPVVSAERMVIVAEQQKAEALKDLRGGNSKLATQKLNSSVHHLRDKIANLMANPDISAESIEILKKEANEIEELARMAAYEDSAITMKRGTESFNRNMRARKPRDFNSDFDSQNGPTN